MKKEIIEVLTTMGYRPVFKHLPDATFIILPNSQNVPIYQFVSYTSEDPDLMEVFDLICRFFGSYIPGQT